MENIRWDILDIERLKRWTRFLGIEKNFENNVRHETDKYCEKELLGEAIIIHLLSSPAISTEDAPDLATFQKIAGSYWTHRRSFEEVETPAAGKALDAAARELNRLITEFQSVT